MTQPSFGMVPLPEKTPKAIFLDQRDVAVPWGELVSLIRPRARGAHLAPGGQPPFAAEKMLPIHYLLLRWHLSDPAMEEVLAEWPLYRRCAGLTGPLAARARRNHRTALLAPVREAETRAKAHGHDQRRPGRKMADARDRRGGGCHPRRDAQFSRQVDQMVSAPRVEDRPKPILVPTSPKADWPTRLKEYVDV